MLATIEAPRAARWTEADLQEALARYPFYHIIRLNESLTTPGNPAFLPAQRLCLKQLKSLDLTGKRVLDIGCRDGLYSFAAESLGAAEVIGIDNDLSPAATEFLIPYFDSQVRMHQMNVYDLTRQTFGQFDVVIFPGVLYHLRYPFWALKAIRDVLRVGGHLIVETAIWEGEPNNAVLFCPIEQDSPYEVSSCTFFNPKGLVDSLQSLGFETTHWELLKRPTLAARLGQHARRAADWLRSCFWSVDRGPIRRVRRGVFHSVYRGFPKDTILGRYWEGTHDYHSGLMRSVECVR
ncbi:MAG TPA: DUF1698 domain-containing protein [Pirellulaceae bacterium]|nr:DUF1698 domain-containing protein [Pirellulaceae bacterium]